jgi:S1-C subfamily serine protease
MLAVTNLSKSYRSASETVAVLRGVNLADGRLLRPSQVLGDPETDIAVLKVEGASLPTAKLGDSDSARIGQWVLALGSPFGLSQSVTHGIVSARERGQVSLGNQIRVKDFLQTDAPINRGNSGGALVNLNGELIGINGRGSFEKRGRVNSGVGYAISINQIKNFLGHLYAGIDTDHATLGAAVGTVSEDAPLTAMIIRQVLDGSDADRRGLKEDDVLLSFAGRAVTSTNMYKNILGIYPKDWRVPVMVRRKNDRREVLVRLMGNIATEKGTVQPKIEGPPAPPVPVPAPKGGATGETANMYVAKKGYANWYFNEIERDKVLAGFKKSGDFAAAKTGLVVQGICRLINELGEKSTNLGMNQQIRQHQK